MALSQIIRFTLPFSSATSASAFLELREFICSHGAVKDQYFGYTVSLKNDPHPTRKDEMCWVIQWPIDSDMHFNASFQSQLNELTRGNGRSLLFEFNHSEMTELKKELESPVTEFATVSLSPGAPLANAELQNSMHKTFTDCYFAEGFAGGYWKYALNTNNVDEPLSGPVKDEIVREERRLGFYYLGWESIAHHQAYSRTDLFFEEIVKLQPWFGLGTGAWYVALKKHNSDTT